MRKTMTGLLRAVRPALIPAGLALRASPFHFGDGIIAERSPLRRKILKYYARFEVPLLAGMYWLIQRPFMRKRWARLGFYWLGGAKLLGERGVVAQAHTLEEIERFIRDLPAGSLIAVGPCRCRLATGACDHPLETDIVILTGAPIWLELFPRDYREIDKEEAVSIVKESYESGLVPMLDRHLYFKGSANYFVICNCCGCSCLPLIGYRTFKQAGYRFIPSASVATVDVEKCRGCGKCVEVCAFGERVVRAGTARILDCQGCGLCAKFCPNGASAVKPRAGGAQAASGHPALEPA